MSVDIFDAFLYNLHAFIGHNATARFIGEDASDTLKCHLCYPELCNDTCKSAHQPEERW